MQFWLLLLFILQSWTPLLCQGDHVVSIIDYFEKYKIASLNNNAEELAQLAHPMIIKKGGGQKVYVKKIEAEQKRKKASDIVLADLIISDGYRIVNSGNDLQAMIPCSWDIEYSGKQKRVKNFLLVSSQDNGKTWNFTDMRKYDVNQIKYLVPNFHEGLAIYINSISH